MSRKINENEKKEYKLITLDGKTLRRNMIFKKNDLVQKCILKNCKKNILDPKQSLAINFFISLIEPPCYEDGSPLKDKEGNLREQAKKYAIPIDTMCECLGLSLDYKNKIYNIKECIDAVEDVKIWLKRTTKSNHHIEEKIRILNNEYIDLDTKIIFIEFHEKCFPFLFNINTMKTNEISLNKKTTNSRNIIKYGGEKGEFIAHELIDEIMFRSKYSRPLLEYLLSFKGFRIATILTNDIREICNIQSDEYKDYYDFKKRVLNPALKEINEYTNFRIDIVEEIKEVSKFPIKIKFLIEDKNIDNYSVRIKKLNALIDGKDFSATINKDYETIEAPVGMFD